MMLLWLGIALLTLIALLFLVMPLIGYRSNQAKNALSEARQQDNVLVFKDRLSELERELASGSMEKSDFDVLKVELEKNLLIDLEDHHQGVKEGSLQKHHIIIVLVLALLLPGASMGLYMKYGSSAEVELAMNKPVDPFNGREPSFEEALAQLETELQKNPNNPEGWYILSSSYMSQSRYQQAADGYRQVVKLLPPDAVQLSTVMGQLAQAMYFAAEGMTSEVRAQVEATLALEPFEITALGLLGADAFEQERFRDAIGFWNKALMNADGDTAASIQNGIARATEAMVARGEDISDIEVVDVASISVNLSVAPGLTDGMSADTPVFLVARAIEGGMPAAAVRLTLGDLPTSIRLTDAQAMAPTNKLSNHQAVNLSARISQSGNVVPQPGDMIVEISPVPTRGLDSPLEMVVSEVVQ